MRKIILGVMIILALGLVGCSGGSVVTPAPTPTPVPVESPEPSVSVRAARVNEKDAQRLVMELMWENASAGDRQAICDYYAESPDVAVDRLLEAGGVRFTRAMIVDFLEEKC